jgi:hypothetical protein
MKALCSSKERPLEVYCHEPHATGAAIRLCIAYHGTEYPSIHHPITIMTSAGKLGAIYDTISSVQFKLGLRAYRRLLAHIPRLDPAYAAISIETPLCAPGDLMDYPDVSPFFHCYLNSSIVGNSGITTILDALPADAYQEWVHNGLYLSLSGPFNPERYHLGYDEAYSIASLIREVLSKCIPKPA